MRRHQRLDVDSGKGPLTAWNLQEETRLGPSGALRTIVCFDLPNKPFSSIHVTPLRKASRWYRRAMDLDTQKRYGPGVFAVQAGTEGSR